MAGSSSCNGQHNGRIAVLSVLRCQKNRYHMGLGGRAVRDEDEYNEESGSYLRMDSISIVVEVQQSTYALNKWKE